MGTPQVWTPKFSKLFGAERKTGMAFIWEVFFNFFLNKDFLFANDININNILFS